ncbi:sulfatase-like hydrolase/transferase [Lentisphaera profundi]|uniref:Sulfatase-like hydrolase/transferase n=1 Tax=Lentisphaera profundi TaxID=1658616 RepID=A0ABY7W0M2_9BACT|nr:sulfatase-like hydrolase/transferase [Lentisphaera profundi]WDE97828.1 sulfatase-like hydrolase/transferase [Lentisphaera profundi]
MKNILQNLSRVHIQISIKSHILVLCTLFGFYLSALEHPNIILMVADDHGCADISVLGIHDDVETPAIDRLINEGTYYTHAYANAPICNVSRTALMTGIHQAKLGAYWYSNPGMKHKTSASLAEFLQGQAYATGYVGKVHYGSSDPHSVDFPLNHGFDEFFGFCGGRKHYLSHDDELESEFIAGQKRANRSSANPVKGGTSLAKFETLKKGSFWRNKQKVEVKGFATEIFGKEARTFIKKHKQDKFFLHLSFNAVHNFTHQLPKSYLSKHKLNSVQDWDPEKEDYLEWYKKGRYPNNPQGREYYLGHLEYMDREIGKILDILSDLEIKEKTMIIYASDNGGSTPIYASNGALRGSKYTLYEGGIRIPLIIVYAKGFRNTRLDQKVSLLDIYPTIVELLGEEKKDFLDGVALQLLDDKERNFFWHSGHEKAMLRGDWKYKSVSNNDDAKLEMVELELGEFLYDLEKDPGEKINLINDYPEKVNEMRRRFKAWEKTLVQKD